MVKVLTKVALAALGISGPFGLIISLIVSFVTAWMKTGDLSVGGITQVFDNLGNTITSVTTMLATNLPKVIQLYNSLNQYSRKITEAIPSIVTALSSLITLIVGAIVANLPVLMKRQHKLLLR